MTESVVRVGLAGLGTFGRQHANVGAAPPAQPKRTKGQPTRAFQHVPTGRGVLEAAAYHVAAFIGLRA